MMVEESSFSRYCLQSTANLGLALAIDQAVVNDWLTFESYTPSTTG